ISLRIYSQAGYGVSARCQISNYQLPITNYPLPITHYPLPITSLGDSISIQATMILNLFLGGRKSRCKI
ncbi:hypothetical protein CBP23_20375, partial [Fischerella thermalis WC344]